jgi:hypothetical protein
VSRLVRMPSTRAVLAAVVSALAWLLAITSHGDDAARVRLALVWKTPAEGACATSSQIRAEVAKLSDASLVERGHEFEIEALALLHEGQWVASVALRDAQGRVLGGREVSGSYASCRDLDVPVALVVSTLLDELRPQPAPPQAPAPAAPPAPAEPRKALGVGAFVAGAFGLAPRLTLGVGAAVELPLRWPLLFSASAYLPGSELDAQGRGARVVSFHAGAALCPKLVGQRHSLRLCGSAQAGAVVAKGVGLSDLRRAALPVVLLGLEPQLVLGLTANWALQVSLGAHWLPLRPRFYWDIEGSGEHSVETDAFALIARIGVIDFLR